MKSVAFIFMYATLLLSQTELNTRIDFQIYAANTTISLPEGNFFLFDAKGGTDMAFRIGLAFDVSERVFIRAGYQRWAKVFKPQVNTKFVNAYADGKLTYDGVYVEGLYKSKKILKGHAFIYGGIGIDFAFSNSFSVDIDFNAVIEFNNQLDVNAIVGASYILDEDNHIYISPTVMYSLPTSVLFEAGPSTYRGSLLRVGLGLSYGL